MSPYSVEIFSGYHSFENRGVAVPGIGGLGHLAVQYAKAAGFETIAISHSPDKDKIIRDLGADEVVRDGTSLTAAGGADIILSTFNSTKSMVDSIQGLRPDGRFIVMGADAEPPSLSLIELLFKRIKIIGSQQNGPEYLYEALDYVAQGKVKSIIETYPLAELRRLTSALRTAKLGSAPCSQGNRQSVQSPPVSTGSWATQKQCPVSSRNRKGSFQHPIFVYRDRRAGDTRI
jgi:D-arabinose 1-dehydrogenase-like Zn-dependent alcohol dehydrogenase